MKIGNAAYRPVLFQGREVCTANMYHDGFAPRSWDVYAHRMYTDVVADIHGLVESRNGDALVYFIRVNTDTHTRTPSLWTLRKFERFFCWGTAPDPFGKVLNACR